MATVDDGDKTAIAEFKPIKDLETEFNSMVTKFRNELQKAHSSCNTMSSESKTRQGEIVQLKKAIKQKEESHSSMVTKFRNELQNAHSRCDTMSSELKTHQGEIVQLKKAIKQAEESHSREQRYLQNMNEENKTHIERLNDHIKAMNTKLKEINSEHSKEKEQLKFELNEANHSLTSKINEEKIRTTEVEYRIHRLVEENIKYCETVKNLNAEVTSLKSEKEQLQPQRLCTMESEAEISERRISELETRMTQSKEMMKQIAKLEAKIKEDETKARKKDEELKKTSRTVKDSEKKTSDKEVYIEKLKKYIKDNSIENAKTNQLHKEKVRELNKLVDDERKNFLDLSWHYNQLIQQNKDFSERLRQAEKEKCDLKLEKDELLLRLSKLAGANLTFNNPNIADLRDEKRPTKLAEEFSELYDNDWTDAFEYLLIEDEKEKTTVMLKLLEHAYRLCNELSTEHKRKIEDRFCTISFRETVSTVEDIEEKSETCTKEAAAMTGGRTNDIAVQTETCDGSIADENLGQEESHSQKTTTEARETTSKDAATQVNRTGTHDELETNEEVDGTALNEERDTENGSKGNQRNQATDDVDELVNDSNGNTVIGDECEDLCACNDDDGQVGNEGLAIDVKERSMSGGSERCLNVCTGKSSNVGNEGVSNKYNKHSLGACSIGDGSVFNDERLDVGSGQTADVENPCKSSSSANRVGDEYDGTEVRSDFGIKGTADDDKDSQNEKDINVGSMTGANDDKEGVSECSNEVAKFGNEGNVGACNNGQEDGDGVKKGAAVIRTEVGDAKLRKAGHVTTVCNKALGVDKKHDMRHVHNGNDDADDRNDDKLNVGYTYNMESSIRKIERKVGTDFGKKLRNEQKKTIMEVGKLFEAELSGEVEKVGTEIILKEQGIDSQETTLAAYVKKCVNICWSMCRHVPPVHIDFPDITKDVILDTNKYKPYTKSGKYVHFIVWPALYLHAGGALLSKGVAQGRN